MAVGAIRVVMVNLISPKLFRPGFEENKAEKQEIVF